MSRGVYRGVYSALPDDPDFQRLSPFARLLLYTCRLCAQAGPGAIFRYYPELLMRQSGLTRHQVTTALLELELETWIVRDADILWVRNGLRHDPFLRLSDPKHRAAVIRAVSALPRHEIVLTFCDYYDLPRPFDDPSMTHPESGPSRALRVPSTEYDRNSTPVHGVVTLPRARSKPQVNRSAHAPTPDPTRSSPDHRPLADLIAGAVEKHNQLADQRVANLKRAEGKLPAEPPISPSPDDPEPPF